HRGRSRAREVEEVVTRRVLRRAFEIGALIDSVERSLDDTGVLARLDLLLQVVSFGTTRDVDQRGHPVEGCEHLVQDRARLDVTRPADDARTAVTAFPGLAFLTLERRDAAVRKGYCLGAVVAGEDDDGIVEFTHVFNLLQDVADVVVHLLHPRLVDAPIFAAPRSHHGHVLIRQHGRDVHAHRVVKAEKWLAGLLGVVAVEPINGAGRDFLLKAFRALQRHRTHVLVHLVLLRPIGGFAPEQRTRRGQANAGLGVNRIRVWRDTGDRLLHARRRDGLLGRALVDVWEAHLLHGIQVVEVAKVFLEAVRRRQGRWMVAQMVLAKLAGGVAEVQEELGDARSPGLQIGRAAGQLRRDQAGAQRIHAGDEGITPRGATLHAEVVHENRTFPG